MSEVSSYCINNYPFDAGVVEGIKNAHHYLENSLWPLVYILRDEQLRQAYVGETTDALERMKAHLKNEDKQRLSEAFLISSDRFNKSATLDIESSLIRYMSADGKYRLLNGNVGIANHHYFQQKELYETIFEDLWKELLQKKVVSKTLREINNSDLFKYSPYKALSPDQILSVREILSALADPAKKHIMVSGSAGTGKSVLAIFLFKLLNTDLDTFQFVELGVEEKEILALVKKVKEKFPHLKMGLVIPMSSFRKTVSKIFSQVKGLNKSMVLGPSDVAKQTYDILLVDESHRLRRRVNLGTLFKNFDDNSKRLGLDPSQASELQWVTSQSSKVILFYDADQSIKPSDVQKHEFDQISQAATTVRLRLRTQLRSKGGIELVAFVRNLLQLDHPAAEEPKPIEVRGYEFLLFDQLKDLISELALREKTAGLSRLVAGYAWPWVTKAKAKAAAKAGIKKPSPAKQAFDMEIEGIRLKWNATSMDWINSATAAAEVGCIHTVQGYDLNYVGVIFGPEIVFNTETGLIEVRKENYHDRNGKTSIKDPKELHAYILHIYSTLILRGIKGAFLYVMDPSLRAYFARYVQKYNPNGGEKNTARIALIQLQLDAENSILVEASRSTMEIAEAEVQTESEPEPESEFVNHSELKKEFNSDSWIACQVNQEGKETKRDQAAAIALLRIVYEEKLQQSQPAMATPGQTSQIQELDSVFDRIGDRDHKSYEMGERSTNWPLVGPISNQVAEKSAVYEKQQWQTGSLESTRFVPMHLKRADGTVYTVLARFERLLTPGTDAKKEDVV